VKVLLMGVAHFVLSWEVMVSASRCRLTTPLTLGTRPTTAESACRWVTHPTPHSLTLTHTHTYLLKGTSVGCSHNVPST